MAKGFLGAEPKLTSSGGGSAKKKKKERKKAGSGLNDIYAVPGAGAAREKAMKKRDVLDYSRFESIGAKEAKKDAREEQLKQIPAGLRGRLGAAGEDMVLDMAAKMRDNPEMRPSPEEVVGQLQREKQREEQARGAPAARHRSVPVARPAAVGADSGAEGPLSAKIDSARSSFEEQMEQMQVESARLEQQQARLEKMASGGPEELLSFLAEQGLSEEEMQVMLSDPSKGMGLLQAAMTKGLGLDKEDAMAATVAQDMARVDDVTAQLQELAAADTPSDHAEVMAQASQAQDKAREAMAAPARPGSDVAAIQQQIAEAQRQMEQAKANADVAAAERDRVVQQASKARTELSAVEKEKERAAAEIDAQTARLQEEGNAEQAEELLAAKAQAEAAAEPAETRAPKSVPEHSVTEFGSPAIGISALKLEVKLALVKSFQEVELELTEREVRLSCPHYALLTIPLAHAVDPDAATAKFSKKSRKLRVELPTIGHVPLNASHKML